jgi:hypothetical protein
MLLTVFPELEWLEWLESVLGDLPNDHQEMGLGPGPAGPTRLIPSQFSHQGDPWS